MDLVAKLRKPWGTSNSQFTWKDYIIIRNFVLLTVCLVVMLSLAGPGYTI
ncbi:hypothetical protein HanPSC8_Chr10g0424631 [Helianthus annuus]|nr:hypothetical protein HanPSC8_Chr10g0424631 [Helianthus annuus]